MIHPKFVVIQKMVDYHHAFALLGASKEPCSVVHHLLLVSIQRTRKYRIKHALSLFLTFGVLVL